MNSNISDKDKKDWEKFLSDKETLPNKDNHFKKGLTRQTATFDLHGYSLNDAKKKNKRINRLFI